MEVEEKPKYIKAYAYMQELLCKASFTGDIALAARILHERIGPNCHDGIGRTPLHYAAENGHFEIIRLLLSNRADIDPTDANNVTPLHLAARNGRLRCVKLLCLAHADIRRKCVSGCTARELASYGSETMCFLELCELGERPKPATVFSRPSRLIIPAHAIPSEPDKETKAPKEKGKS